MHVDVCLDASMGEDLGNLLLLWASILGQDADLRENLNW